MDTNNPNLTSSLTPPQCSLLSIPGLASTTPASTYSVFSVYLAGSLTINLPLLAGLYLAYNTLVLVLQTSPGTWFTVTRVVLVVVSLYCIYSFYIVKEKDWFMIVTNQNR